MRLPDRISQVDCHETDVVAWSASVLSVRGRPVSRPVAKQSGVDQLSMFAALDYEVSAL